MYCPGETAREDYKESEGCSEMGCGRGRSSVSRIPAKIRSAPARDREPSLSPKKRKEVTQAKTGSNVNRRAVWVGGRCCWAQLWIVKAAAVASSEVTRRAAKSRALTWRQTGPPSGRVTAISRAAKAICSVASCGIATLV